MAVRSGAGCVMSSNPFFVMLAASVVSPLLGVAIFLLSQGLI